MGESVAGTATRTNMVPAPAKCRAHPYPLPFQWARTLVFGKASDCGSTAHSCHKAHPCHKGMTQDSALRNETPSRRPVVGATIRCSRPSTRFPPPVEAVLRPARAAARDRLATRGPRRRGPGPRPRLWAHGSTTKRRTPGPGAGVSTGSLRTSKESCPPACSSSSRLGVTAPNCRGRARGTEWLPRDARDEWKALRRGRRWCGRL